MKLVLNIVQYETIAMYILNLEYQHYHMDQNIHYNFGKLMNSLNNIFLILLSSD